ncbi:uncharacterized protein LOC120282302 [Dioscorea cayenensis subsp. rotundata]|uniref:Uncharacterized protein LOC120282302 n=1 Tax=Dioscorea cayennensis subsp. rotundata TaxID=55577 RepID=A0AB40CYP1_DIOCR|nr:uncharacterized protein LOC120282302 [Dioscorea cayenensis subsp. rotundata]
MNFSATPTKKWFLDWQFENYDKEYLVGAVIPKKQQQASLLQNCDLPPPVKYFSPTEFADKQLKERTLPDKMPDKNCKDNQSEENENTGLLRALQLSQTRAREAEKKASTESTRNKEMTDMIFKESMKLYAHRQWVKLLDIEISMLNKRSHTSNEIPVEADIPLTAWCLTLALCIGIAGVGFAFGCCLF